VRTPQMIPRLCMACRQRLIGSGEELTQQVNTAADNSSQQSIRIFCEYPYPPQSHSGALEPAKFLNSPVTACCDSL